MEQAMRESLMSQQDPQPGSALQAGDLERWGLYFESQDPGSDTCGLNALNNLCQRSQFKTEDLQKAEAAHARATDGGSFAQMAPVQSAPKGFFDVEALKIAADKVDLQIVDVEPVVDFRKSKCFDFAEAARTSADGSWFLGFLVYDRQPGQMHYYALRRDERYPGSWLKLDSLVAGPHEEPRNRRLSEEEMWRLYENTKHLFQKWLLRWYPVVYRGGAAKELRRSLMDAHRYTLSDATAQKLLAGCGWVVSTTVQHMLHTLPQKTVRELLVKFARPSEAEMRCLLEAAQWDLSQAQPVIDQVLRKRIALAQGVDTGTGPRQALSVCDWDPSRAASILALQLQTGAVPQALGQLGEALEATGGDVDKAEATLSLLSAVGNMVEAATLLNKCNWSLSVAKRILQVREKFPRVAVGVAIEALRRNDDDPHAAREMLMEFRHRVQQLVIENAAGEVFKGEEVAIADTALNSTDWDPGIAFVTARNIAFAVQQTRQLVRKRGYTSFFSVDVLLPALTAGDMKPSSAVSILLGMPVGSEAPPVREAPQPGQLQPSQPYGGAPAVSKLGQLDAAEEEDTCTVM